MMWNKYKSLIISLILVLFLVPNIAYTIEDSDSYNRWDYHVYEEEEDMVDLKSTTADVDYEENVIKLPKLSSPDLIKFTSTDSYDYVVLDENGFKHYAFNGEEMILINSLSKDIDEPIGIAVDIENPSYYISEFDDDGVVVRNYYYSDEGMRDNPLLEVIGLEYIYSLSTFETGELAVVTEDSLKVYAYDGSGLVPLPMLSIEDIENPLSIATNTDYHIAILTEEKVEHYMFDGDSLSNIPIFEIAITDDFENPKAIVIDDDKTFILDEKDVKGFSLSEDGMTYNAAFSISSNLERPQAIAFNRGTKDILIVDEIEDESAEDNKYIAKYFMFDGEEYVLNMQLSREIEGIAVGKRYHKQAEFITNTFLSDTLYVDMFRIRAFTETPKDTEIEFFVAYDIDDEEGDLNWIPLWKIVNENNEDNSEGILYKANRNGDYSLEFGRNEHGYPTFDKWADERENMKIKDEDIIVDEDGNIVIDVNKMYDLSLWAKMNLSFDEIKELIKNNDDKYSNFKIKAVLRTKDRKVTPKIFLPIGDNNEKGLDLNAPAMIIEANAEPLPPDVSIKDPIKENPPEPPKKHDEETLPQMPDRPGFDPVDGWVYTTTPYVQWEFVDFDEEYNPFEEQVAYQILLLARDGYYDWYVIYDSDIVEGDVFEAIIPTTWDDPVTPGPMWDSGSYEFAVAVRTWDTRGAVSDFGITDMFKVLAFERPRVANVVYPNDSNKPLANPPTLAVKSTHKMIEPDMGVERLPTAKAGAQVTLLVDSVGPINLTEAKDIPLFYITLKGEHEGVNVPIFLSDCKEVARNGKNKTWEFNFFTSAPIDTIPDDTIVKASFVGESDIGGTTVLYVPNYASGVVKTWETIYKDWQVIIEGRDR